MRARKVIPFAAVLIAVLFLGFPAGGQEKGSKTLERVKVGASIPVLEFEDVYGKKFSNQDYQDWIIVYSFADRLSNKPLQEIIGPAGIEVVKAHPELRIVYVSIADLLVVPTIFREMVVPILKKMNDKNNESLKEAYKIWRVPLKEERSRFFMVPDLTGTYLKVFGLENAKDYHVFVVYKSKVRAVFDSENPPYVDYYLPVFDSLSKSFEKKAPVPETRSQE